MTSKIKVDNINKVSDDSNIINKCGTNITMGVNGDTVIIPNGVTEQVQSGGVIQVQSGGAITIASGATITNNGTAVGLGRTGTVDWATTPVTATFTASNAVGYFCNTSGGAFTITLPASPSAGDIVGLKDYAGTFATSNLTIGRNGSNLDGTAGDKALNVNNTSLTLIYVDTTQGWKSIEEGTGFIGANPTFITASGGTVATIGDFKIHKFTGPGTFTVCSVGNSGGSNSVDHMVVAGGGGGGFDRAAGGGGGGFRLASNLPVAAQGYSIVIGAGGPGASPGNGTGFKGSSSSFSSITSTGGGGGGSSNSTGEPGGSGGGGGSANPCNSGSAGGTGNTPPVSPSQGNNGGTGANPSAPTSTDTRSGGGGGGGGGVGGNAVAGNYPGSGAGGPGGAGGNASPIFGSNPQPFYGPTNGIYSGGAGGSGRIPGASPAPGGTGGGGRGATPGVSAGAGAVNSGGGGGGGDGSGGGSEDGGSGIILIRYKFQ